MACSVNVSVGTPTSTPTGAVANLALAVTDTGSAPVYTPWSLTLSNPAYYVVQQVPHLHTGRRMQPGILAWDVVNTLVDMPWPRTLSSPARCVVQQRLHLPAQGCQGITAALRRSCSGCPLAAQRARWGHGYPADAAPRLQTLRPEPPPCAQAFSWQTASTVAPGGLITGTVNGTTQSLQAAAGNQVGLGVVIGNNASAISGFAPQVVTLNGISCTVILTVRGPPRSGVQQLACLLASARHAAAGVSGAGCWLRADVRRGIWKQSLGSSWCPRARLHDGQASVCT